MRAKASLDFTEFLKWLLVIFVFIYTSLNAARVLFDYTKNETAGNADWVVDHNYPYPLPAVPLAPTDWDGAISSWGYYLYRMGHEVATLISSYGITYGNPSNPFDLSNFDVFVMPEPQNALFTSERCAILNFIFNITGERPNYYSGVSTNIRIDYGNAIYNGPFGRVQAFGFWGGTCITLKPFVNPNVYGLIWVPGAQKDTDSIMFCYGFYGRGRFVGLGDSSPCDDGTGDPRDVLYNNWSQYSDSASILNATLCLMGEG